MSEAFGSTDEIEFFERKIRPLFAEHCYSCHSVNSESLQAGLLMDSRASLLAGGDSGEAIVPGDVDGSLLVEAVRYESYEMPPRGQLPAAGIQAIEQWIEMGAPWPKEDSPSAVGVAAQFDLQQRKADHWVWQPIQSPTVPEVVNSRMATRPTGSFCVGEARRSQVASGRRR